MNEKMLDVKDLITAVDKEIVFLHYCEGHIRHHRECWNVLRKYMENRNECFLTADIAQQYLQERYGIELYLFLPILATYLGHKKVSTTEKYLRLTAEAFPIFLEKATDLSDYVIPGVPSDE